MAAPLVNIWLSVALRELLTGPIQSVLKSGKNSPCFAYVLLVAVRLLSCHVAA